MSVSQINGGSAELAGYCCDFNGEAAKFVVKSRLVPPDGRLERMTLRQIVIPPSPSSAGPGRPQPAD